MSIIGEDKFELNKNILNTLELHNELKVKVRNKLKELLPENTPEELIDNAVKVYISLPYVNSQTEIREDNLLLAVVFPLLAELQYRKEGSYGRSWCKRGELDIFFNTARKFDRIENIMLKGAKDEVGESHADTVADLTNYGLLWMTYILREKPALFFDWLKNNL